MKSKRIKKVPITKVRNAPRPHGKRKNDLISVWTIAWPVINDKDKDREGAGRRNLEHSEQRQVYSPWT